jgi:hypothetical protein
LPSELEWPLLGRERHVDSWEHIRLSDARRLPQHVLVLLAELCGIEGIVNFRVDTGELTLEKGLAWQWSSITSTPQFRAVLDAVGATAQANMRLAA